MSKFCIGEKVIVNDQYDLYFGFLAKVTSIQLSTFNEVPKYEIQFIEDNIKANIDISELKGE